VNTVLGLLGILIFIPCVIALAAALTWIVVKVSPAPKPKPVSEQSENPTAS
jgi:hypothetical protein